MTEIAGLATALANLATAVVLLITATRKPHRGKKRKRR